MNAVLLLIASVAWADTPDPVIETPDPQLIRQIANATSSMSILYRAPIGHTHTHCVTWDHTAHAGHDCPVCGVEVKDPDRPARMVTVGTSVSSEFKYMLTPSAGGCVGGNCPVPSASEEAWYLGKNLGRRKR